MRVHELAKQLNVSSKSVQLTARRLDLQVKSPSSIIEPVLGEVLSRHVLMDVYEGNEKQMVSSLNELDIFASKRSLDKVRLMEQAHPWLPEAVRVRRQGRRLPREYSYTTVLP